MKALCRAVGLALALGLATPAPVAACSGWIDCWLGISSTVEIRQSEQTERERITAARDAELARIQAEAQERVRQADAEVERVRQQQYQTEAQRAMAIAQIEQQAEQYKALIAGLTAEKLAGIQANANSQIAALHAQAEIATAGILETGRTERWRIAGGWTFAVVAVVVAGLLLRVALRRQPQQTIVLLATPRQFRHFENHGREIEGKNAKHYLSQN